MIKIYINNNQNKYKILKRKWKNFVQNVLKILNYSSDIELGITFVDDDEIIKLNNLYKKKNTPTDVLAFNYQNKTSPKSLSCDIVISVDTAKRQAEELGHDLNTELSILVIHGILHLSGYDDGNKKTKTEMFAMQQKILERV